MVLVEDKVRAEAAYSAVLARVGSPTDAPAKESGQLSTKDWKSYRTIVLKLPVMVHREGLPVALHFVAARGEPAQRFILDDLASDLGHKDSGALLAWARGLSPGQVRDHTREIQRRLGWYKRVVQAFGRDGRDPSQPTTGLEATP
jgi:hypothetical protein